MSVQLKILAACLGFVAIIAALGGLAQQQVAQMGRLAIGIYDHAFMGMSYVSQAQEEFLRLAAAHRGADATLADKSGRADLQKVLLRVDVALERAATERTRDAGKQARALLVALPDAAPGDLAKRIAESDLALVRLVKKFSADGLAARDDADALATESTHRVLLEIAVAVGLALGVGWLVGRNLSRPLVQLVHVIGGLAAGELDREITPGLLRRRDEIGKVARAAAVFREAMQQNAQAGEQRAQLQVQNDADKVAALCRAADDIERETAKVTSQTADSSALLLTRGEQLTASTARVLVSADAATQASAAAVQRGELVAAAGDQLSAAAREIASQIAGTAAEITNVARAGERAQEIIAQLSAAVGQIGTVAGLIRDIAGRTNLLALNATIEAARAGEAGRGFAVVASEVKALARQTAQSTEEITRKAGAIRQATQDAVTVVGEMVERVASIERITQAVAAAAEQQTAATGEIARNVAETAADMRIVAAQVGAVTTEARDANAAVGDMRTLADTVGDRIADLRGTMVRIVRISSAEANRRKDERVDSNTPATLVVDGSMLPATCINLSLSGARVRVDRMLDPGCSVTLRLAGLPDLPGKVLNGGEEAGLRFEWDADSAPAELHAWLGRQAAA